MIQRSLIVVGRGSASFLLLYVAITHRNNVEQTYVQRAGINNNNIFIHALLLGEELDIKRFNIYYVIHILFEIYLRNFKIKKIVNRIKIMVQ